MGVFPTVVLQTAKQQQIVAIAHDSPGILIANHDYKSPEIGRSQERTYVSSKVHERRDLSEKHSSNWELILDQIPTSNRYHQDQNKSVTHRIEAIFLSSKRNQGGATMFAPQWHQNPYFFLLCPLSKWLPISSSSHFQDVC